MTGSPSGTSEPRTLWKGGKADEASLAGARVTVDLAALAANWRALSRIADGAETGAVVKANAYGLGIEMAAPALYGAGARTFFVALAAEGRTLRETLPPDARIFVLNGAFQDEAPFFRRHRLVPFLSSAEEIEGWARAGRQAGEALAAAINVDTGMNRLGIAPERAERLFAEGVPEGLRPVMVASHLACADEPDHPMNAAQRARFSALAEAARTALPDAVLSFANSGGTLAGPSFHFDLVRPGIALYGARATRAHPPLSPVVTLETRILQVREVAAGETIGYGAAETARRDSRVAIASLGYADGYLRAAGGSDAARGAPAMVAGVPCRLMGRVSMDLVAIDVTDAPPAAVRRGDWVELFGRNVPIDEVAAAAGTIGHELLTGLSRRAARATLAPPGLPG